MAKLELEGKRYTEEQDVRLVMGEYGVTYEHWGVRASAGAGDDQILGLYADDVSRLQAERGYLTADLIALRPDTPNLDAILAKFDREHHHADDEVRFTVEGEGVFEIATARGDGSMLKFTSEPGDLLVIPALRRHLFRLTAAKTIRTIRVFKTKAGWEAIYQKPS